MSWKHWFRAWWLHCTDFMGGLWDKSNASRAAAIAVIALGLQTLRWILRAADPEDSPSPTLSPAHHKDVKEIELSPRRATQLDYSSPEKEAPDPSSSDIDEPASPGRQTSPSKVASLRSDPAGGSSSESHAELLTPASPARQSHRRNGKEDEATSPSDRGGGTVLAQSLAFPEVDYEPQKSPFDLRAKQPEAAPSPAQAKQDSGGGGTGGRHVRMPSFPVVDYEPEPRNGSNTPSSQAESYDMVPAPTEAGDAVAKAENMLEDLQQQAPPSVRRHSRSFSEPNLVARLQQPPPSSGQVRARDSSEDDEDDDTFAAEAEISRRAAAEGADKGGSLDSKRSRLEAQPPPPLLRLDILSGPSSGRDITIDNPSRQVWIGRAPDNLLAIEDNEVSSKHAVLLWSSAVRAWQVQDAGSLNGTRLNGNFISNTIRRPGRLHRLNSDDILLLGSRTAIKVVYLPNAGAPEPPQHLKRVAAPPSMLQPTTTLRSEAMASLRAEVAVEHSIRAPSLRLTGAVLCRLGVEHQRNGTACEDVPFWGEPGRYQAALYCVFDGHCGRKTAAACTRLLPEELRRRMPEIRPALDAGVGVGGVWEEVFLATDAALDTEDGATATAVLVWRDAQGDVCLQAANVGDSAAVFCKGGSDPREDSQKLTADHRISDPSEQQRLADLGIQLGKNRTRLYGLNLSRCLGDKYIKGADLGFTAVPAVSPVVKLRAEESAMLVIASDGLWDVAEPRRVMELAFEAQQQRGCGPEGVAETIYQHAMKQRSRDDVCVVVLCFQPDGSATGGQANGGSRVA